MVVDGREATFIAPIGGSIIGPLRPGDWWTWDVRLRDCVVDGKPIRAWHSIYAEALGHRTNVVQEPSPSRKPRK